MTVDHVPTPFGDLDGGGIRCSCGWVKRTTKNSMREVWRHYRKHWSEVNPGTRQPVEWDVDVEERHLFDPAPYAR